MKHRDVQFQTGTRLAITEQFFNAVENSPAIGTLCRVTHVEEGKIFFTAEGDTIEFWANSYWAAGMHRYAKTLKREQKLAVRQARINERERALDYLVNFITRRRGVDLE